jgi:hypothetical protein
MGIVCQGNVKFVVRIIVVRIIVVRIINVRMRIFDFVVTKEYTSKKCPQIIVTFSTFFSSTGFVFL